MIWSRIFMSNGMRYDFAHDVTEDFDLLRCPSFIYLELDDRRTVFLNRHKIVSIEVDKGET